MNAVIAYLSDPFNAIFWFCILSVFVANEFHGRRYRRQPLRVVRRQPRAPAQGMAYEAVADPDELPVDRESQPAVSLRDFFHQ
jgi:hypothetical protein